MSETVDREIVLEYVNTQRGHLRACIERRLRDGQSCDDLQQLLDSLEFLRLGLKTDNWSGVII